MPAYGICAGCGALVPKAELRRGRCPICAPAENRRKAALQPWRRLYSTGAWQRARKSAKARDGGACVVCQSMEELEVHHREPLTALWREFAGDWPGFVAAACRIEGLRTYCSDHHHVAERARRQGGAQ